MPFSIVLFCCLLCLLLPQRMTTARADKLQDELVTIERERNRKEPEVEVVSQQLW